MGFTASLRLGNKYGISQIATHVRDNARYWLSLNFFHLKPVHEHSNKKEIDTIIIEAY